MYVWCGSSGGLSTRPDGWAGSIDSCGSVGWVSLRRQYSVTFSFSSSGVK
jgi:hypothetical protein